MSEIEDLLNGDQPVLVDFWADWCNPCKMMNPVVNEVISELDDAVLLVKVDTSQNRDLTIKYGVRTIPTFVLFKNGEPLWRQSGVIPAQQLVQIIQSYF
jgi:thioredoxin 1